MGIEKDNEAFDKKRILWLPFCVNCGEDYVDALSQRLKAYKRFVITHNLVVDNKILDSLCTRIPQVLKEYTKGNVLKACGIFTRLMDSTLRKEIQDNKELWINEISNKNCYYRLRPGKHTDPNSLKHIPFNQLYLTKSDRFSSQGSVCLYLSYTKKACRSEITDEITTIASFKLKDDVSIKVFDMSAYELNKSNTFSDKEDNHKKSLNTLWPLIAACNSIAYYCPLNNKECKSITRNFKIEYVIPQMLASYIKEKFSDLNVRGIRYYTVRNEMLDPSSTDWMDLVLFTEYEPDKKYDSFLEESFDVTIL